MSAQTECACTDVLPASPAIFCDVPVGRDTTGNFTLSFKGLAVRADCNRFIAFHDANGPESVRLYDVTGLTLHGCDALVYRVPVTDKCIGKGDLVLIADCPLDVLYVTHKEEGPGKGVTLTGFNARGEQVTYRAPERLGDCGRYVRLVSVLDVIRDKNQPLSEELIVLVAGLLCCKPGHSSPGNYSNDFMSSTIVENLLTSGAGKDPAKEPVPLEAKGKLALLLALQQSQCLESYILTKALQGECI